ncbi:hypothetical protein vseg_002216 [Gypsophila vaccaria]
MKNMKRVFLYLGMGSCISKKTCEKLPPNNNININNNSPNNNNNINNNTPLHKTLITSVVQPSIWQVSGSKEEQFYDSKAWLESDDEDFVSVNGDMSPPKQMKNEGDHQGRRLSDLFKESTSFSSDSQTSFKVAALTGQNNTKPIEAATPNRTWVRKKSAKRCLPSLVRSLSCGDRKNRSDHVAVEG